ncbi:superoxide dismutase family protein [Paludisphaera sp.]|uniref:superoxide dismutase family protein n=1 Tax=Paludisphaera sp. TaxID=2017432 RepID=UPI00301C6848
MTIYRSAAAVALCGLIGLATPAFAQHADAHDAPAVTKAEAIMIPTKGSRVEGRITFTQEGDKMHVQAILTGLTPGPHGFHIHEFGVWSEDGMATGGHFNPTSHPHADVHSPERHVGDLGNIVADEDGKATLELKDSLLKFHGPTSILGRGVVVHEKADDLVSQPSGDAGGRLAVGTIGVAKP